MPPRQLAATTANGYSPHKMKPTKKAPKTTTKPKTAKKRASTTKIEAKKKVGQGKDKQAPEKKQAESTPPAKVGRPTIKTPELIKKICEGIAEGKSARAMCIEVGINRSSLLDWLSADPEFSSQYARAKELSADYHAEGLIELSDEKPEIKIEDGKILVDPYFAQTQRLRFDARKWYASKLAPKKYGDKTAVDVDIPAGGVIDQLFGELIGSEASRIRPT